MAVMRRRKKQILSIGFDRDEQTGKLYLWNTETGYLLTVKEINELLDQLQQYMETVGQEIQEINQQIRSEELKERYRNYLNAYADYTHHVLSKQYHADQSGYVVCYEDHEGYIRFDCTKKTKHQTLPELLNHLRNKIKKVHLVYEATEAKKLCTWLDRLFAPGIRRYVFLEDEDIIPVRPYEPDFKEYLIQSLKEQRHFPKGIRDLIVEISS